MTVFNLTGIRRAIAMAVAVFSIVAVFALVSPGAARAQGGILSGSLTAGGEELPPGVHRVGNVETANVEFENQTLFTVTGPVVRDRQHAGNLTPVDVRVSQIEGNLQQVLSIDLDRSVSLFGAYDTFYDPRTFRVSVTKVDDQPVLVAGDREHPNDLTLLTVTAQDARYNEMDRTDLAQRWQRQLETVLVQALNSRQPQLVRRHLVLVPKLIGTLTLLSIVLWFAWRRLRARRAALTQKTAPLSELESARIERRIEVNSVFLWITASSLVAIWLGGLVWILSLFPATAVAAETVWAQLLRLVLIWFLAGLLDRLANALINHFAAAWTKSPFLLRDDPSRRPLRVPTIVRVVEGFKAVVIYLSAVGISFDVLGFSTVSVLTIGAAVALAASLAAQGIIKDLTNGFLILAEDQYAIGDVIMVGALGGIVENLTLRVTQLRNDSGRLITIPNSQIAVVENLTRTWSRIDFTVNIAYDSDLERATEVISGAAQALYSDPKWSSLIAAPPEILGVESFSCAGVAIRVWIVTLPLQQYPVGREFNRRVYLALRDHDIRIGMPQQGIRAEVWTPDAAHEPEVGPTFQRASTR
ncbi:MAG: mechanosensitive ion channel family protein [Candidatus Velthaea sp.]|jgi:small conductance mechanosensitive channel